MMKKRKNSKQAQIYVEILNDKFKVKHTEMILSLQYFELRREQTENAEK